MFVGALCKPKFNGLLAKQSSIIKQKHQKFELLLTSKKSDLHPKEITEHRQECQSFCFRTIFITLKANDEN